MSAAYRSSYEDLTEDEDVTVEINTSELAKKLEESGEYDMAIRLRRSSRPPGPSN
ncbi:MAG: hypothetical protein KC582_00150 [Candidatus Magasanikbacteria bacterium]|nr:hypothetical protein [Candidatus Magasanikbacteria bacterium]